MEQKRKREYNIELLRCISMLMIIILHYNNEKMGRAFQYVIDGSKSYYMLYFMQSICIVAVNIFVIISGYFMSSSNKRSLRKPFGLYCMVVGYRIICSAFEMFVLNQEFDISSLVYMLIPQDWFVNVYIVLYFVSPYINIIIEKINQKSYQMLLIVLFLLCSCWITMIDMIGIVGVGYNPILAWGGDAGYSIVQFVFMYFIGAYIRIWYQQRMLWKESVVYIVSTLGVFFLALHNTKAWYYNNVFVVVSSCALFVLFLHIKISNKLLEKIISIISASTFGIYLLHTNALFYGEFWRIFNIKHALREGLRYAFPNMLIATISMYIICGIIDKGIGFISYPMRKLLNKSKLLNKKIIDVD